MSDPNAPPLSSDLLASLLASDEVRDAMRTMLQHNGFPHALEDIPRPALENLLAAMIKDGVITVGPGRILSQEEVLALFDEESDDDGAKP